jgi:DNA polymerase-3 subunit delta'
MALEFARVLRCERGGDEACDECESCRRISVMMHPDVRFVTALPAGRNESPEDSPLERLPDSDVRIIQEELRAKAENPYHRVAIPRANVIKINSIREIRRDSSLSTLDGKKRIFIVSQADAMEPPAANTLLKTLEEPPGHTMIVLTTAHREALLPTIVSRCQQVRFDPLTVEEIRAALVKEEEIGDDQAALVARLANGNYIAARQLLREDVVQLRADVVDFVRKTLRRNVVELLDAVETIADTKDRELASRFLTFMLLWFRDALVLSHGGTVINADQQDDLKSFVSKFPEADLVRAVTEIETAISLVERYAYIKLVLIQLAVQLKNAILPGAVEHAPADSSRR